MRTAVVDRRKLYEQMWSIPCARLALQYGISDVGLAKVCRRFNIPRPPRGYWARIAAGERIRKPPLPRPGEGDTVVFQMGWNMNDELVQAGIGKFSRLSTTEIDSDPTFHEIVEFTRLQLLSSTPDHDGLLSTEKGGMDVRVSPPQVDRAMTILNRLVKRWEARGGSLVAGDTNEDTAAHCKFRIGPDGLEVVLSENVDDDKPLTDPGRLTSRLALHVLGADDQQFRRRWSDTKSQRLERMLDAIVDTLASAIGGIRQKRLDEECVARQKERANAVRKVAERDESEVFYSRQRLMQNVRRWVDAQQVRSYLDGVQAAIEAGKCRISNAEQFEKWFDWASKYADSIDPLLQGPLPEGSQQGHQNIATTELDLTTAARCAVDALEVPDTDSLWRQSQDAVRKVCQGRYGSIWNEITRVLEGLGYDVSKRKEAAAWW